MLVITEENQEKGFMTIPKIFIVVLIVGAFSCRNKEEQLIGETAPYIDITLFLSNQENLPLQFDRGYVYVDGGIKGVIVYRENASDYRAFDRVCTYHVGDSCALVSVDSSSFFMRDPCCGSQFDFSGGVTQGPANRPMVRYTTYLQGNTLRILN